MHNIPTSSMRSFIQRSKFFIFKNMLEPKLARFRTLTSFPPPTGHGRPRRIRGTEIARRLRLCFSFCYERTLGNAKTVSSESIHPFYDKMFKKYVRRHEIYIDDTVSILLFFLSHFREKLFHFSHSFPLALSFPKSRQLEESTKGRKRKSSRPR